LFIIHDMRRCELINVSLVYEQSWLEEVERSSCIKDLACQMFSNYKSDKASANFKKLKIIH